MSTGQIKPSYPPNVIAVSDTLTILEDMGNHIPDKSWMLYLLELFDRKTQAPIELDLICQFNNRDNFWAIFRGINRHKFTKVMPIVGHSYRREIIMRKEKKSIEYLLTDLTTQENEDFSFDISGYTTFSYQGGIHFTGIEWWNKAAGGNSPFPVRYKIEVANISFGQAMDGTTTAAAKPVYRPYNTLIPNNDGIGGVQYPVSFEKPAVKDGKSIRYAVASGKTATGMHSISNELAEAV